MKTLLVLQMISEVDLHWLAGLIEGDGSIFESGGRANLYLGMTDKDVVHGVANLLGVNMSGPYQNGTGISGIPNKVIYRAWATGAQASSWMKTLCPHLGERRRAQISAIFPAWDIAPMELSYERTPKNIAWLAGIVESEGSISADTSGGNGSFSLQLQVAMTDEDVIARVARMVGKKYSLYQPKGFKKNGSPYSIVYTVALNGKEAAAWLMTLYCFFGERRREAAKKLLYEWRSRPAYKGDRERCLRGHVIDGKNDKQRFCKTCERERMARRRATRHDMDAYRRRDAEQARERRLRGRIGAAVAGIKSGAALQAKPNGYELGMNFCAHTAIDDAIVAQDKRS